MSKKKPTSNHNHNQALSGLATTPRTLLSDPSMHAIIDTWPKTLFDLIKRFAKLPPQDADPLAVYGYIFAIDSLRDDRPALAALATVVNELEVRPRYHEMLELVDRVLNIDRELVVICQDTARHHRRMRQCK